MGSGKRGCVPDQECSLPPGESDSVVPHCHAVVPIPDGGGNRRTAIGSTSPGESIRGGRSVDHCAMRLSAALQSAAVFMVGAPKTALVSASGAFPFLRLAGHSIL